MKNKKHWGGKKKAIKQGDKKAGRNKGAFVIR